jgi:Protein of unknown function (DUF1573)
MKKILLASAVVTLLVSCDVKRKDKIADGSVLDSIRQVENQKADELRRVKEQQEKEEAMKNATTVQLIDSVFDFGTVSEGEKVEFNYRFKNTGNTPLMIFSAHASCGCTVPEKPEKPILPGETGSLKVVFNSQGKAGHNSKDITVEANTTPAFPILKLTGQVNAKQ